MRDEQGATRRQTRREKGRACQGKTPSVAVPPPGVHVPALDGVRGVAILMVLVLHLTTDGGIEPTIALDRLFCRLAMLGWVGVDLFFVLSGYLITGILYDTKGGAHCLR